MSSRQRSPKSSFLPTEPIFRNETSAQILRSRNAGRVQNFSLCSKSTSSYKQKPLSKCLVGNAWNCSLLNMWQSHSCSWVHSFLQEPQRINIRKRLQILATVLRAQSLSSLCRQQLMKLVEGAYNFIRDYAFNSVIDAIFSIIPIIP